MCFSNSQSFALQVDNKKGAGFLFKIGDTGEVALQFALFAAQDRNLLFQQLRHGAVFLHLLELAHA